MKRLLAAMLALAMVTALAGCSGKAPSGTITQLNPTEAPAETPTEAPAETPTEAPTEATVSLGRMTGGVYENTYAGFACTLDESWTYYTAAELQDLSDLTQEALQDSALAEQTGKFDNITDMMAESQELLASININYTRLSAQERIAFAVATEEQIVDTTLEQEDTLVQTYAQMGIDNAQMEKTKVTFLGQEHTAIHTSASIQDLPYYILQLFCYNLGGQYYVTITLATFGEDNTAALLDLFTPV